MLFVSGGMQNNRTLGSSPLGSAGHYYIHQFIHTENTLYHTFINKLELWLNAQNPQENGKVLDPDGFPLCFCSSQCMGCRITCQHLAVLSWLME